MALPELYNRREHGEKFRSMVKKLWENAIALNKTYASKEYYVTYRDIINITDAMGGYSKSILELQSLPKTIDDGFKKAIKLLDPNNTLIPKNVKQIILGILCCVGILIVLLTIPSLYQIEMQRKFFRWLFSDIHSFNQSRVLYQIFLGIFTSLASLVSLFYIKQNNSYVKDTVKAHAIIMKSIDKWIDKECGDEVYVEYIQKPDPDNLNMP